MTFLVDSEMQHSVVTQTISPGIPLGSLQPTPSSRHKLALWADIRLHISSSMCWSAQSYSWERLLSKLGATITFSLGSLLLCPSYSTITFAACCQIPQGRKMATDWHMQKKPTQEFSRIAPWVRAINHLPLIVKPSHLHQTVFHATRGSTGNSTTYLEASEL